MPNIAIVPAPASVTELPGDGFTLGAQSSISATGDSAEQLSAAAAVGEYLGELLRPRTGFELAVNPLGADAAAPGIRLVIDDSAAPGYSLHADADGITVTAASAEGLFSGVQTLRQLFPARIEAALDGSTRVSDDVEWTTPAVQIEDAPRFAYRGAMLDVARNVFSVAAVKRYIDDIALLKLNVLHLHLTDDQGWRLQIDSWPRLTEIGASTSVLGGGGFYTKADYTEIVDYAASRFITLVPEIDLPGHTNAALASYPELNIGGVATEPYRGVEVGFSTVDTTADATWRFVEDVVRELAEITPGPYIHLGGDESLQLSSAEFSAFVSRASEIGAASGKTVIGWHEMGQSRELAPGTIGQYWDFVTPRADAAPHTLSFVEQGGQVIMSPSDVSYLDMHYPDTDRLGQLWADGPTSVEEAYSWEPTAIVTGLDEAAILGVEAPVWTETLDGIDDVEFMVFPRLAPIAEIAWSPAPAGVPGAAPDAATRSFAEFSPRLAAFVERLDALGVRYHRSPELSRR
ncbi:beta-N-acetylhexosaminidase [Microterricola viridarii]|uniref:beta-N-acetylhexosaminidase n=1 Tax=Microterricola viridarii TaxID=412690 RepID=A0A109QWI8_9MICO|nr:beta-N-acetylhexosaminidase [Microterricola viridarii]AMB57769.1 beta-N-acetylhexosaminidase [Microterricola viridarii]